MPDEMIVNTALSENTLVYGRTLNSARMHHFVIDGARHPKEELTPVEVFLSAVSACCVQWIEQFAREDGVLLSRITVEITASRQASEPNRFERIDVQVNAIGPSQMQLEDFVNRFTERCPLYCTVAAATKTEFAVHAG